MLGQRPPAGGDVQFVDQSIQYPQPQYAMLHRGLEKFRNVLGQFSMRGVVEPSQFRDATDQLDETQRDKVLQRGSVVCQIPQDVVSNIDPLGDGEVIPMGGNELGEAVRGHQQRVLGFGSVEDVLALGYEGGGALEAQETGLGLLATDDFIIIGIGRRGCRGGVVVVGGGRGWLPEVECFAEGFDLGELSVVHGWLSFRLRLATTGSRSLSLERERR